MTELWPEELRLSADRATLAVRFNDGRDRKSVV